MWSPCQPRRQVGTVWQGLSLDIWPRAHHSGSGQCSSTIATFLHSFRALPNFGLPPAVNAPSPSWPYPARRSWFIKHLPWVKYQMRVRGVVAEVHTGARVSRLPEGLDIALPRGVAAREGLGGMQEAGLTADKW